MRKEMRNVIFEKQFRIMQSDDLTDLVERICHDNNIGNYFGTISVAIGQVLEMILNSKCNAEPVEVRFSFAKCVGGVVFKMDYSKEVFKYLANADKALATIADVEAYIVNTLADKVAVLNQGKCIELQFLIGGIEPELLSSRLEKIQDYFENKILHYTIE